MSESKIYKCLISSPSDVQKEREFCIEVFGEINKVIGEKFNFRVEPLMSEDVSPGFSSEPQAVINEQLITDKEIELFIGIMWVKFGTPTKNYQSGTEEEFNAIYDKKGIPIFFYFNHEFVDPSDINTEQLSKVNEFKEKISKQGIKYEKYNGSDNFKTILKKHLDNYFLDKYSNSPSSNPSNRCLIQTQLTSHLTEALHIFDNKDIGWTDRNLYEIKNTELDSCNPKHEIDIQQLIKKPYRSLIYALPRFGLTCLSRYLILEAWKKGKNWIYFNAHEKIWKTEDIQKYIEKQCKNYGFTVSSLKCIVIDAWSDAIEGHAQMLRNFLQIYPNIPFIIMVTDGSYKLGRKETLDDNFRYIHLSPMKRTDIRTFLENRNETTLTVNSLVENLEKLNIHRTPEHCLMLCKAMESSPKHPINRTKMISMVLRSLFDSARTPSYSEKPDVEHCKFLLGYFCAYLSKEQLEDFSKIQFYTLLNQFIKEEIIKLNIDAVFSILHDNKIIIPCDSGKYRFRHFFWINYFCANHMTKDEDFYKLIVEKRRYLSHIEIIEFYTGIKRDDNALIQKLINDQKYSNNAIEKEFEFNLNFNPLKMLRTKQKTKGEVKENLNLINEEVLNSSLPENIKDEYADRSYDMTKANEQSFYRVFEGDTYLSLHLQIQVSCMALRNSEFIKPELKKELLDVIIRGWRIFSIVVYLFSPYLAKYNKFSYLGYGFVLIGKDFLNMPFEEKLKTIWCVAPKNIINMYKSYLHSDRISPLLSNWFNENISNQERFGFHLLAIFLIKTRPTDWQEHIRNYIESVTTNSFYFTDLRENLIESYKYDWATKSQIEDMEKLIHLGFRKELNCSEKDAKNKVKSLERKIED